MMPCNRRLLATLVLSLLVQAGGIRAQWKIVAPHLIKPPAIEWKGAMCFRDGITWIARDELYRSSDSGLTWTRVLDLAPLKSGHVEDIDFFDKTNGVIVDSGGSYITNDGGLTWAKFGEPSHSACFGSTVKSIAIGSTITSDGGVTRFTGPVSNTWVQCVRPGKKDAFVFSGGITFFAPLYQSLNAGLNWKAASASIDEDSWSFAIDSCDNNRIYMSNENVARPTDDYSKILLTTDLGTSWKTVSSFPRDFFAGSVAESRRAIYCPSLKQGVFRSIDKGNSWTNIGGPNSSPDTRLIAVIDDNIVIMVDSGGNVWRTINSGGHPVTLGPTGFLTIGPKSLFETDTLRCDSLVRSIGIVQTGCATPAMLRWSLIGLDGSSYHMDGISSDSLRIGLVPTRTGSLNASIVFVRSDGAFDTVRLGGFNASQIGTIIPTPLSLFQNDTLRCDTITRFVRLNKSGCFPPVVDSISFIGQDANAFAAGGLTSDSVSIVFHSTSRGNKQGKAVLHKSDGGSDTISLGGVDVGFGKLSPPTDLFSGDTAHCNQLARTLSLNPSGCEPPSITSIRIADADSTSFLAGALTVDSLLVTFAPSRGGSYHASLILTLGNGAIDTIVMDAFNDVGSTIITPSSLFIKDTLSCDTLTRGLKLRSSGCAPPTLASWKFGSADSIAYSVAKEGADSLSVTFLPNVIGDNHTPLIVAMNDGSRDTIDLRGYTKEALFAYTLDRQSVFSTDSLYSCEAAKVEKVSVAFTACHWPHILSQDITGPAQADYTLTHPVVDPLLSDDSVVIAFSPSGPGARVASYEITFDDGTHLVLPLDGYGNSAHQLGITTSSQSPTTLGDVVQVPITIGGLARAEDIELVLHYDPVIPYRGSFSPTNMQLDIPGQQWKGRSKLRILQATANTLVGNAEFDVFNDSSRNVNVHFDSLVVVTAIGPCQYIAAPPADAEIILPTACGMPFLSRYLHYGHAPAFSVSPNPTTGDVRITSSSNFEDVTIVIYDALGVERGRSQISVRAGIPANVSMPSAGGLYYLRLETADGVSGASVVVSR